MIEVRIRLDEDTRAVRLCEWPSTDLDNLIPAIGAWGVFTVYGEYSTADLVGQICVDDGDAYFEIVIITEDP